MRYLFIFILLALLSSWCYGARVVHNWDIGYVMVNRDGYNLRRAIGINGKLPVPPVYITVGDILVINVVNSLDAPTTIHAHGLLQNGTGYMDGAGMVTQCGIPPGTNFTYEHYVHQAGTFWLHGHFDHQNVDGLRTPLIVYDKDLSALPMQYDEDVLMFMEEWYPVEFHTRMDELLNPTVTFPPPASFPFGLINGFNGNETKPICFMPRKKYRLRVVNMASTEWFKFSLPGHILNIIEADGIISQPLAVDGLDIGPGQRYSVVVQAHNSDEFNYIYNATLYANFVPFLPGLNPRYYQGLIEYKRGAPVKNIATDSDKKMLWAEDTSLQAFDMQPALKVDRTIRLVAGSRRYKGNMTLAVLDKVPYRSPLAPTLFTALSMGHLALDEAIYGPQTEAHVIRHGQVIEIDMHNPTAIDHAMHLHGHTFQIIESGPSGVSSIARLDPAPVKKFSGWPMKRDTVVVAALHYVKLRFVADNPGVWLFHCHMDVHFALGLAVTFVEAPDMLQRTQSIPKNMIQMCLRQGIKASGNGADNKGFDLSGLPPVSG
ncbi:ferroxidase fet3 [Kickxella alabastrina]|nr:ferroxidase fet3 [Kickxella alabastrina]